MLLRVFIFHLVKFMPSWQAAYRFITSVIFRSYRLGEFEIHGETDRARECEWVKNKLSNFVDRRLVFAFNSFDIPWKIVWLTSNGFFQWQYDPQSNLTSLKKNLDRSFDGNWTVSSNYDEVTTKHFFRTKNQKPRKVYKQRPAKWILKQDSSGDLSSSEKSEETLFKSEEEDKDY